MDRYNGWKNYETWLCQLWIDNERTRYEFYRETAKKLTGERINRVYELSLFIEDGFEKEQPLVTGFYADLLTSAIAKIDFYEIAESIIDELEEE